MRLPLRTPLARKNLTHDVRRLGIALGGVGFAVVLMFMETGFKNALFDSMVEIVRKLDADVVMVSKAEYCLLAGATFDRARIYQARACPGVASAHPLYVECYSALWKPPDRRAYPIRALAFEPGAPVLTIPGLEEQAAALRAPRSALVDVRSKSKFGFPRSRLEPIEVPEAELSDRAVRAIGTFELGSDYANDGNVILSDDNFARYFPYRASGADPLSRVDLAVIHVRPDADVQAVLRDLSDHLPDDVRVFSKAGFVRREMAFWSTSTPIGYVFLVGMAVGFAVGVIVCYQVIHSNISDHLGEFATLKAMGYRNRYFIGVVLQQSCYLAVLSFLPGLAVSLVLYHLLARWTGLVLALTVPRAAWVLLLTTAMCVVSGCLAIRKVLAADPAELF